MEASGRWENWGGNGEEGWVVSFRGPKTLGQSKASNWKRPSPRTEMEIPSSPAVWSVFVPTPHTHIHNHPLQRHVSLSLSRADSKTRNSETRIQINGAPLKCQSHLPFRAFILPSHAALSSSLPLLPLCPTNSPETNGRRRLIRELGPLISIKTRFSLPSLTSFLVPFHFEVILYEIVKMWK